MSLVLTTLGRDSVHKPSGQVGRGSALGYYCASVLLLFESRQLRWVARGSWVNVVPLYLLLFISMGFARADLFEPEVALSAVREVHSPVLKAVVILGTVM